MCCLPLVLTAGCSDIPELLSIHPSKMPAVHRSGFRVGLYVKCAPILQYVIRVSADGEEEHPLSPVLLQCSQRDYTITRPCQVHDIRLVLGQYSQSQSHEQSVVGAMSRKDSLQCPWPLPAGGFEYSASLGIASGSLGSLKQIMCDAVVVVYAHSNDGLTVALGQQWAYVCCVATESARDENLHCQPVLLWSRLASVSSMLNCRSYVYSSPPVPVVRQLGSSRPSPSRIT